MSAPRLILGLALAALLAGCGADGPPVPPAPKQAAPHVLYDKNGTKVTVSGEASVGVAAQL